MIDVNHEIVKKSKRVSMSLSGGADSAILFYHACDVLSDKTFIVWSGYDTRRPDSIFYAMEVYQFVKNSYPNVDILPHHTFKYTTYPGMTPTQSKKWDWKLDPKSVAHHEEEVKLWKEHRFDFTLNGMTSNPPEDAIKKFKMDVDTGHGVIEPRRHNERDEWIHSDVFRSLYSPFVKKDKSYVRMMYEKYGVLDTLFPLTASCIGFPHETNNGQKPCRNCVWCKERLWAFGEEHLQ